MGDMAAARLNMVESQVRPNQVTDARILNAMLEIPRELFVPQAARSLAYMEEEVVLLAPKGEEPARTLIAPMPLARLIQLCGVDNDDLALDVGCASGYSTAVLAALAGGVVGLECHQGLAGQARQTLAEMAADNVEIVAGPLEKGYSQGRALRRHFAGWCRSGHSGCAGAAIEGGRQARRGDCGEGTGARAPFRKGRWRDQWSLDVRGGSAGAPRLCARSRLYIRLEIAPLTS